MSGYFNSNRNIYPNKLAHFGYLLMLFAPFTFLLNTFLFIDTGGLSIRLTDFIFILCWIILLFNFVYYGSIEKEIFYFFIALGNLVFLTGLGIFLFNKYSVNWPREFRFFETILWGALAFKFINDQKKLDRFINNIMITGAIMSAASIFIYFSNSDLHRVAGYVSFAGGEGLDKQASYNEWGSFYAIIISILIYRFFSTQIFSKFHVGIFLLVNCGLLLDQSRSSFLAIAVVVFVMLLFQLRHFFQGKIPRKFIYLFLFSLIFSSVLFFSLKHLNINRFSDSFVPGSNSFISIEDRLDLWKVGINLLFDQFGMTIIGHGNNYFFDQTGSPTTDNFYLDHTISDGFIGILLIFWLLLVPTMKLWKKKASTNSSGVGILIVLIALTVSLTGNVLVDPMYGGITFALLYSLLSSNQHGAAIVQKT